MAASSEYRYTVWKGFTALTKAITTTSLMLFLLLVATDGGSSDQKRTPTERYSAAVSYSYRYRDEHTNFVTQRIGKLTVRLELGTMWSKT
jgi:hypothetical protein